MPTNTHYTGTNEVTYTNPQNVPMTTWYNTWHTYGVDWEQNTISFYLDGSLVRTINQTVLPSLPNAQNPTQVTSPIKYLMFDSEIFAGYGIPNPGGAPIVFNVDYVRAWTH